MDQCDLINTQFQQEIRPKNTENIMDNSIEL